MTLRTPAKQWAQELLPLWSDEQIEQQQATHRAQPRYNIAPTQNASCVLAGEHGRRRWEMLRWGLIPPWADDLGIGNRMINARSETVDEKRSFKNAFAKRRCLVPADGYYEWMKTDDGKQPYLIEQATGGVFALAGLWEANQKLGREGQPLVTFTILTTDANATTASIHHRMPVIIEPQHHELWLDPKQNDIEPLKELCRPLADDALDVRPVSKYVNSPRNESPKCVEPFTPDPPPPAQQDLF